MGFFDFDPFINETPSTLYKTVTDELAALWQPGAQAYIEANLPGLANEINLAESQLNWAWCELGSGIGDLETFKVALESWRQVNLRAIKEYEEGRSASETY